MGRVATVLATMALPVGCGAPETSAPSAKAELNELAPVVTPEPATPAAPPTLPEWLLTAIDRGVTPPGEGGSTYYVDPFVAALVVEQARAGKLPVTLVTSGVHAPGYRLDDVDSGGLLARLGFATGDVVEALNATPLEHPDALVPVLAQSGDRITARLYREDYSMTLEYRMVGGLGWSRALAAFRGDVPVWPRPPDRTPGADTAAPDPGADPTPNPPARPRPSRPGATPPPSKDGGGNQSRPGSVRCPSPNVCEIDQATFDRLVQDPSRLKSQATIVPAIRNDIQSGYKLKTVQAGTNLHALGFRSGDKITHINGHFLGDDAQAMSLYFKLPATRVFNVKVERGPRRLSRRVHVR